MEIPTINADVSLNKTGNLPKQLICLVARVMVTTNANAAYKLINGACGQGMYQNPLHQGSIYVKFDDPSAANSKNNRNFSGELKECVSIRSAPKTFPWNFKSKSVTLLLGYAMTNHKSQGSGFYYILCDLIRTSNTGKENTVLVNKGQFYTHFVWCK